MNDQFENTNNVETPEDKKKKKADNIKPLEVPNRKLPKLINDVLEKGFSVILVKNGYLIEGFYGINTLKEQNKIGFAFCQETSEDDTFIFFDSKGHKHIVKDFKDLVSFNSSVWSSFYKVAESYKKPDSKWFPYMLELDVLNITPGK